MSLITIIMRQGCLWIMIVALISFLSSGCSPSLPVSRPTSTVRIDLVEGTETPFLPIQATVLSTVEATLALPIGVTAMLPYPAGGWIVFHDHEHGFSFEYPSVYDQGECGAITVTESEAGTSVSFTGGTIEIAISPSTEQQLNQYVESREQSMEFLAPPEDTTVDAVPAVALEFALGGPSQYRRETVTFHNGMLYIFGYSFINFISCDAPPISGEAVYEHILLTWRFDE